MASSFFVVPQWQGSGSSRAMHLAHGAEAIGGDLPPSMTVVVPVPLGAGSDQGTGVRRLSSVETVRRELQQALASATGVPIVIGGDCGVELGAIRHAAGRHRVAVVWFDAHADLNSPGTSPSGAFHGMVLRTLLGEGPAELLPDAPLNPRQVILAGTRSVDEAEQDYIAERGIRTLPPAELTPSSLAEALQSSGADAVYLHIDLDVLDPSEFGALDFPEPFGVTVAALIELVLEAKTTLPIIGAGITEFAPGSTEQAEEDLPTILRIIGALTSASPTIDA
ncbi:MAG: arginase family protein [Homoserinimonas sp.]